MPLPSHPILTVPRRVLVPMLAALVLTNIRNKQLSTINREELNVSLVSKLFTLLGNNGESYANECNPHIFEQFSSHYMLCTNCGIVTTVSAPSYHCYTPYCPTCTPQCRIRERLLTFTAPYWPTYYQQLPLDIQQDIFYHLVQTILDSN